MRSACLLTDTLISLKTYWLQGHLPFFRPAKHCSRWGQRGSWLSWGSCFVSFCFCSVWVWHEDSLGRSLQSGKVFLAFYLECLLRIKSNNNVPISTWGCRGKEHAFMPHLHDLPVASTLVMTYGKGHTLALCVPDAASYPVMDSPLCHHHLLLGPGQNQ